MSANNDNNGAFVGLALVGAAFYFIAIIAYALACFIAAIFTVLAIIAWEKPVRVFGSTICHPIEARTFVTGGIAGAIGVPAFALFCAVLFDKHIPESWWFYMITGGYSFASLLAICKLAEKYPNGIPSEPVVPVIDHVAAFPLLPAPVAEPFRYASWDDETVSDHKKPVCGGCAMGNAFPGDPSRPVFRR